jgi:hypothetical protein
MGTLQLKLNRFDPGLLAFLKRRQEEGWSEQLPDGTPAIDAAMPSKIGIAKLSNIPQAGYEAATQQSSQNVSPAKFNIASPYVRIPPDAQPLPPASPNVNQFASPSAQDFSQPALTRYAPQNAAPPVQPGVPVGRFSRIPPSTETQQDASTIPVGDRRAAIMDASNQLKRIPSNNVTYEGRASTPSFDAPPLRVNPEAAQDASTIPVDAPVASPGTVRRISPTPDVSSSSRFSRLPQQDPQQNLVQQDQQDLSVLPVGERRKATIGGLQGSETVLSPEYENLGRVIAGKADPSTFRGLTPEQMPHERMVNYDGSPADSPAAPSSPSAPPAMSAREQATEQRRTQLEDRFAKLLQLENTKAVDKNGRLKSGLLSALRGFLQGVARTGSLAGGIGGAATAGIYGAVHPAYDEEMKQAAEVLKERGKLGEALQIEKELAGLDVMGARAAASRAKASPDVLASASHTAKMRDMTARLRAMGGTYTKGKDKVLDSLVTELGVSPKRGGTAGFNPAKVKVVGGNLVYVESPDLPPVVLYSSGMSEADRQRNAIALEQVNNSRTRLGLPPLMFAADLPEEGGQSTPGSTRAPTSNNITVSPSQRIPPAPPASRARMARPPAGQPASSVLAPVPGAKAPAVTGVYGRRGGNGRLSRRAGNGSAGGTSKADQIGNTVSLGSIKDVENARTAAEAARQRGEDGLANQYDAQADSVINATVRAQGSRVEVFQDDQGKRRIRFKGDAKPPTSANPVSSVGGWPARLLNPNTQSQPAGGVKQYTEAEIRAEAMRNHHNPDAAVKFAKENGRLKQ